MKKILIIVISIMLVLSGCASNNADNSGKSASELAPEGMNELTFGYGDTACKTIEDYLNGEASAEEAKTLINFLIDGLNKLEIDENAEEYGYNLSVGSYLDQFQFYLEYGNDEDLKEALEALKGVLKIE